MSKNTLRTNKYLIPSFFSYHELELYELFMKMLQEEYNLNNPKST